MDMDFKNANSAQLVVWANLHNSGTMVLMGLMEYVDAAAAQQIRTGAIQANAAAFRNFLAMVDILETSIVNNDGYLDRVYDEVRQAPYLRKLWDKLTKTEFTEALALALHNNGVPVRQEYMAAPVSDAADDLEDQWGEDNIYDPKK
jgi:hypothetical protein